MQHTRWFWLLGLALTWAPAVSNAAATFTDGKGYQTLASPQPVSPAGKVVVLEFFSYGCGHCAQFEPELEAWARKLPRHVVLERVPVALAPRFEPQQRLYYALRALGKADALQQRVFDAVTRQRASLDTPEAMATWLQAHGVARKAFLDAYNSFAVQMQARRASQMAAAYRISGVPAMAVQGRYLVTPGMEQTPTMPAVLQAVDSLVARVAAAG